MNTSRRTLMRAGAGVAALGGGGLPWRSARAQAANTIKIALLCDMSGTYRDVTGPTELACVRQAAAEFGNRGFNIEVVFADNQNKPDVGSNVTRQWFDREGVDAVVDGGASSVALAVNDIVREKNKVFLNSSSATSDLTGSKCTPNTVHWTYDTWMLAKSTGGATVKAGGDSWYFITADYAFGHALERDTAAVVTKGGGKVLGSVKHPLSATDFSSFLIQARSSGAKVVGMALAGTDMQNCIKQAAEFGLTRGGARIVNLLVQVTDIVALGQRTCEGMVFTDSFYWDMTDRTREWSRRFMARMATPPGLQHAAMYTGVMHWLKA